MQALILAGGEGTRLRPLTSTIPKPVAPLANRPHMAFMTEWLRRHGVDEVILACGFMADDVRRVLGDETLGVRIRYVEEPEPLGTGGALRYAGDLLDERFLMLNGDVLSDFDVSAQLEQHERAGARATLALYEVEDPSAYGLVRLSDDGSVSDFSEKPTGEGSGSNLINAGVYVLERSVLEEMPPPGVNVSIERDVFPKLVGRGLHGLVSAGYWLDIGTPERYLEGNFDILQGRVETDLRPEVEANGILDEGATVSGRVVAPALLGRGASLQAGAVVGGRAVLGPEVVVGPGAHVEDSVVLGGVRIGANTIVRGAIIGPDVVIGEDCRLDPGVMLGQGVTLGDHTILRDAERVAPGESLPASSVSS